MLQFKIILVIKLIGFWLTLSTVETKLVVQLDNVFVNNSDLYKANVVANIHKVNRTNKLTVHFTTYEDVNDKLMISLSIYRLKSPKDIPFIKNITSNLCSIFRKPNFPPILMAVYIEYLRHTDMPARCPMLKGTYHITDYHVRGSLLPSFTPRIAFRINLRFYQIRPTTIYPLTSVSVTGRIIHTKN